MIYQDSKQFIKGNNPLNPSRSLFIPSFLYECILSKDRPSIDRFKDHLNKQEKTGKRVLRLISRHNSD